MRIAKAPVGLVFCLLALPIVFGLDVAAAAQTPSPTRSNRPPLVGTQWRLMSLSERPFLHMAFRSYFTLKQATGASGQIVNASAMDVTSFGEHMNRTEALCAFRH